MKKRSLSSPPGVKNLEIGIWTLEHKNVINSFNKNWN